MALVKMRSDLELVRRYVPEPEMGTLIPCSLTDDGNEDIGHSVSSRTRSKKVRQVFSVAVLLLATSAAFAQPAGDKPVAGGQISQPGPPPGGATIPPEQRSKATKDVPMGNGKPKANGPAPTGSVSDKRAK